MRGLAVRSSVVVAALALTVASHGRAGVPGDADTIYDGTSAQEHLEFIRNHMGSGHTPLGAELEFSNIGHNVIRDPDSRDVRDAQYDGFLYFLDFGLDVLTWKLGGHLDDHHQRHRAEGSVRLLSRGPGRCEL